MSVQSDTERRGTGTCSDCGTTVRYRIECVDVVTHSTLELCETCWNAYRQRQVFSGECCG
jgi:hypothetical protein